MKSALIDYASWVLFLALACRFIYTLVVERTTNLRAKYFKTPKVNVTTVDNSGIVFKATPQELFKRFIWLLLFISLFLLLGFGYGWSNTAMPIMMAILFGIQFVFRLFSRLAHANTRLVIDPNTIKMITIFGSTEINMHNVSDVSLYYYVHHGSIGKSIYPSLVFIEMGKKIKIDLPVDFFLDKAELILQSIRSFFPDKKYFVTLSETAKADETLTIN